MHHHQPPLEPVLRKEGRHPFRDDGFSPCIEGCKLLATDGLRREIHSWGVAGSGGQLEVPFLLSISIVAENAGRRNAECGGRYRDSEQQVLMRFLSRVLWREGMHLTQHHFQAQGRYVEDSIASALTLLSPSSFGATQLVLDDEAVRNGMAVLRSASGIMPDGSPFYLNEGEMVPPPLAFADRYSPVAASHLLHLALPAYLPDGPNIGSQTGRYRSESRTMRDTVTGTDAGTVELAHREYRLTLDTDLRPGDVELPIARIVRDGSGHYRYDADFIPPCLKLSGSERLLRLTRDIAERLEARNTTLSNERQGIGDAAGFAAHEVASFWMLHTIRSHVGVMRHHLLSRESHPERLYIDLARLVGELSTFTLNTRPQDIPPYNHHQPETCFAPLVQLARQCLDTIVSSGAERVNLTADRANFFGCAVPDERHYRNTAWILGVRVAGGDLSRAGTVPQLVKVCSRKHIERVVNEGRAALALTPLGAPPAAVSPRPGVAYFDIQLAGPCWELISRVRDVGVYVPDSLPGAEVVLHLVST